MDDKFERLLINVKTRIKFETVHDTNTGRDVLKCDKYGNPMLNKKYNILKKAQASARCLGPA
jgi:hypothetical protein